MTVYTLQRLHNFTHRLVISSLTCPTYTSFGAQPGDHQIVFSQRFPARKKFTLRFHRCGSYILQRPPLVPRLGDKLTQSPKSRKSHPVLLPRISAKLEKQQATQLSIPISALLCAVNMVTHSTNRSLGSLAGTTIIKNSTCHTRFLHQNQVFNVCMTHDQLFHTYIQKGSQITKCHE
jgi:hypothetical protein